MGGGQLHAQQEGFLPTHVFLAFVGLQSRVGLAAKEEKVSKEDFMRLLRGDGGWFFCFVSRNTLEDWVFVVYFCCCCCLCCTLLRTLYEGGALFADFFFLSFSFSIQSGYLLKDRILNSLNSFLGSNIVSPTTSSRAACLISPAYQICRGYFLLGRIFFILVV